jgi:hypothetical protein
MTENEQIEEMAKSLCGEQECGCDDCNICEGCIYWIMASELYAKGYRKVERGEWRWISDTDVMCDICGKVWSANDNADAGLWKRCPNCGADMRGATDER